MLRHLFGVGNDEKEFENGACVCVCEWERDWRKDQKEDKEEKNSQKIGSKICKVENGNEWVFFGIVAAHTIITSCCECDSPSFNSTSSNTLIAAVVYLSLNLILMTM